MADCCNTSDYDNHSDHHHPPDSPALKVNILEDEGRKNETNSKEKPLLVTATTPDKSKKPSSGLSKGLTSTKPNLDLLNNVDPVGSSASPQIAECDSAQSSQSMQNEATRSTTTVECEASSSSNGKMESATSPETSICAVSSTVDDDDERECRTVSSSFENDDKEELVKNLFENSSVSDSSAVDLELPTKSDADLGNDKDSLQTNDERQGSDKTKTLLTVPRNISSSENIQEEGFEKRINCIQPKNARTFWDSKATDSESVKALGGNINDESESSKLLEIGDRISTENDNNNNSNGDGDNDDNNKDLNEDWNENILHKNNEDHSLVLESGSKTGLTSSIHSSETEKFFNPSELEESKDRTKEETPVFTSKQNEEISKVSLVNWSKSIGQHLADQKLLVTSTVFQNASGILQSMESQAQPKNMSTKDQMESDSDTENVITASSNQKDPSSSIGGDTDAKGQESKFSDISNDGDGDGDDSRESASEDVNTDVNTGNLLLSPKISHSVERFDQGFKDSGENDTPCLNSALPTSLPPPTLSSPSLSLLSSSANSISSSSSSSILSSSPLAPPPPPSLSVEQNVESDSKTSSSKSHSTKTLLKFTNGLFECELCRFSGSQVAFEEHLFKHMKDQTLRCDECSSDIYSVSAWHQHLQELHEGEHVLPTNISNIINHVKMTGEQMYNLKPFVHLVTKDTPVLSTNLEKTLESSKSAQLSPSLLPSSLPLKTDQCPPQSGYLEFTFVNKEYFCLKCAKKSKDREVFRFHVWNHTHSSESTYCCCTVLTRESCELVANIIQLISNMNESLFMNLTVNDDDSFFSSKEKVVICRVRKTDLKLETVFRKPSEILTLQLSTLLLADQYMTTDKQEDSPNSNISDHHQALSTVKKFPKSFTTTGASDFESPKTASLLKETVIVENPLRAGSDHTAAVKSSATANKGCEKANDAFMNPLSADSKESDLLRVPMKNSESIFNEEQKKNAFDESKSKKAETNFSHVKIKQEPNEDLLLADINQKILNIKKEVKEFASLTDMLCDINSSNLVMESLKTEQDASTSQDEVLDLKVSSSLSQCNSEESKKTSTSLNSLEQLASGNDYSSKALMSSLENFGASLRSLANNSRESQKNLDHEKQGAFYKCGFKGCHFSCMNSLDFGNHLENAHKYMTFYPCAHCGHTATGEESLLRHMQSHTMSKVFLLYKCAFQGCRFGTNLLHEFRDHNEIFHPHETSFRCLNCSVVFYEVSDLVSHLKNNLLKFIQCPHCSVKDRNRQAVLGHISKAHPGKPKQIVVTSQVVCREKQEESHKSPSTVSDHPVRPFGHANSTFLPNDDIEFLKTKLKFNDIPPLALKKGLDGHQLANLSKPNNNDNDQSKLLSLSKEQLQHFKEITDFYLHSCKLCKYSTNQAHLLEEHIQNYHPSFLGDFIIKRQSPDSSGLPTKQKDMVYNFKLDSPKSPSSVFENKAVAKACCHLCPVAYKHVQQLKTHVRMKHPKCQRLDFYKCIHCNAKSTSKEYLVTSCKKRHPNKEFHLTQVQEVLEHPKKKSTQEVLDIIVNHNKDGGGRVSGQRCEHGCVPPCIQCDMNATQEKDLGAIKHWKKHLFGKQGNEESVSDYEKPFVCKVFKNMVKPTKVQKHSPILTVPSAKNALPKISVKSKSKGEKKKKKANNATSTIDNSSDFLPPCEIGSQTLDAKLSVLYTRNRKWNRCKCCQFTTDHVATIHHHILDCHLKLYLWTCPYCDLKSIKKQNIIQHCLHFHESKKPGAKFENQDWNKHIRSILNLLPKDMSASTFTKQTFIISGPSSEAPNCYRLATEPLSIPASLTKPNRPTVVKLSNGVYKCSVCSTKGFVEWQVQRHIDTEHWSELKESGMSSTSNIVLNLEGHPPPPPSQQTDVTNSIASAGEKVLTSSDKKALSSTQNNKTGLAKQSEEHPDDIELSGLSTPSSKDEEMKAMARKIIEVSPGVLQCPFCSYRSRLRTCVKCHIWSQHMMLKRKRCKHCSFASWFDSGIEAHMATEHPRLCFNNQSAKSGYTVLVEEPDGTWKETMVNFVHATKDKANSQKRPNSKSANSASPKKKSKNSSSLNPKSNASKKTLESSDDTLEVLNLSSNKSKNSDSSQTVISRPGVITSSSSSSSSSNKPIKPGLVISPKFFKMNKSGVINISKSSLATASPASDQPSNAPTLNKLNLINVPKFKARSDSLLRSADNSDDEASNGSKSSNREQNKINNIFSRLLDKSDESVAQGQSLKQANNNGTRRKSIEKALPDSLIGINTRMEEMCVREFDEELMRNTFTCTICSYKSVNRTTFNSHTYSHKPPAFKCGYCPFRANPRCRVTAHIRKYHKEPMIKIINLSNLTKKASEKNPSMTLEEITRPKQKMKNKLNKSRKENANNSSHGSRNGKHQNVSNSKRSEYDSNKKEGSGHGKEELSYNFDMENEFNDGLDDLGDEDDLYSSLTFCCHSCSFKTKNIDRFTKHTSLHNFFTHGMKVACMDCSFSTNRILDYEDHISRHMDGFLFYCGCCSFSSLEEQEVREHSLKKHPDRVISIEISPGPPSLSTKWSPVDLDPSVELTDFLAMDCERFYNLISMYGVTMVDLKSTAVSYEDMNVRSGSEDSGTEHDAGKEKSVASKKTKADKDVTKKEKDNKAVIKQPLKGQMMKMISGAAKKRQGKKLEVKPAKQRRLEDERSSDDSLQGNPLNESLDLSVKGGSKNGNEELFGVKHKDKNCDKMDEDNGQEEEEEEEDGSDEKDNIKVKLKPFEGVKLTNTDEDSDIENDGDIEDEINEDDELEAVDNDEDDSDEDMNMISERNEEGIDQDKSVEDCAKKECKTEDEDKYAANIFDDSDEDDDDDDFDDEDEDELLKIDETSEDGQNDLDNNETSVKNTDFGNSQGAKESQLFLQTSSDVDNASSEMLSSPDRTGREAKEYSEELLLSDKDEEMEKEKDDDNLDLLNDDTSLPSLSLHNKPESEDST